MRFPAEIEVLAQHVIETYTAEKKKIVTAESCTGGLLAAALTTTPGASEVFERGFIAYSYDAKSELLGVLSEDIIRYGAVSAEIAEAMAAGALEFSQADVGISITGIAGPGGGMPNKPVGLTYFGVATRDGARFHLCHTYSGDRHEVRTRCIVEALGMLLSLMDKV